MGQQFAKHKQASKLANLNSLRICGKSTTSIGIKFDTTPVTIRLKPVLLGLSASKGPLQSFASSVELSIKTYKISLALWNCPLKLTQFR
jgi:hypothetical protein